MRSILAILLCTIALSTTTASGQTTWHVDDDTCPGVGAGTEADPFCSIQPGIDASADGDEVLVAPGTYFESIDFNGKAITLRSSDGADVTTIDGAGLKDSVVKCVSGEGLTTVLNGFTVTGGLTQCGGGMLIGLGTGNESGATVSSCVFTGNIASVGGGVKVKVGSSAVMTDCVLRKNLANVGGGISNDGVLQMDNCALIGNTAAGSGGGLYGIGDWTVTNCIFGRNTTTGSGGGVRSATKSRSTFSNCVFSGNLNSFAGGGIASTGSSLMVEQSVFVNNTSKRGGGLTTDNDGDSIINCLFIGNVASDDGGGIWAVGNPTIGGSAFCGNTPNDIVGDYNDAGGNTFPDECPAIGGCCLNGFCIVLRQSDCGVLGGTYQGDDVECEGTECNGECPADLSDDGVVNAKDLAQLLGAWGPCE